MEGKPSLKGTFKSLGLDSNTIKQLIDRIANDPNLTAITIGSALVVIVISILIVRWFTGKSSYGRSVLMVGLSESGKTVLFSQLVSNQYVKTVTSMKENGASLEVGNKSVYLLDLPGYDRLRMKFWDDFKGKALGIIFVVDSLQFMSNVRDVADFMYTILADPVVNKKRLPLLVACNKQDEAKAKSAKIVQKQLEKEINAIRETRGTLGSTDGSDDSAFIGNPNREFQFSDLKMPIEFVDCSSTAAVVNDETSDESDQLDHVREWFKKVA